MTYMARLSNGVASVITVQLNNDLLYLIQKQIKLSWNDHMPGSRAIKLFSFQLLPGTDSSHLRLWEWGGGGGVRCKRRGFDGAKTICRVNGYS